MVMYLINDRMGVLELRIRLYVHLHSAEIVAGLARVKGPSVVLLFEKDEVRDLLVGDRAVLHRAQVDDLPVNDEVTLLVQPVVVFAVLIARNLALEPKMLQRCLQWLLLLVSLDGVLADLTHEV